jgi:subtilisin family serine protease
MIKYA